MALPTAEEILAVLQANVFDPEIGLNIVNLGLVYGVQVIEKAGGTSAEIKMTLTSPGCPIGPQLIGGVQTYIHQAFPALDEINIHIVWDPLWSPEMMTQEAKDQLGFF